MASLLVLGSALFRVVVSGCGSVNLGGIELGSKRVCLPPGHATFAAYCGIFIAEGYFHVQLCMRGWRADAVSQARGNQMGNLAVSDTAEIPGQAGFITTAPGL